MLIDRHLPEWEFGETHRKVVAAGQASVYEAARHLDFSRSWITRWLLRIRGMRVESTIDAFVERGDFELVAEDPPHEFVIWLEEAGKLHIAWNFHFVAIAEERTHVTTMTRVHCLTPRSKRLFRLYWLVVRPFSGLIRREMLRCLDRSVVS